METAARGGLLLFPLKRHGNMFGCAAVYFYIGSEKWIIFERVGETSRHVDTLQFYFLTFIFSMQKMKTAIIGSAVLTSVAIVLPVLAQTDYSSSTTGTTSSDVMDAQTTTTSSVASDAADAAATTDLSTEADDSADTTTTDASASVSSDNTTDVGAETDEDTSGATDTTGTTGTAEDDDDTIPNELPATGGGYGAH